MAAQKHREMWWNSYHWIGLSQVAGLHFAMWHQCHLPHGEQCGNKTTLLYNCRGPKQGCNWDWVGGGQVKCGWQGLSPGGPYKVSSSTLVGEEEVLEVKGKIRNTFFPYFFPIYICCLIKKNMNYRKGVWAIKLIFLLNFYSKHFLIWSIHGEISLIHMYKYTVFM